MSALATTDDLFFGRADATLDRDTAARMTRDALTGTDDGELFLEYRESESISLEDGRIRAAGYDLFLVLEVTIGFNKRGEANLVHRQKLTPEQRHDSEFNLTNQDAQFLRALKISVEQESE